MNTLDAQIRIKISERAAEWFAVHRADALTEQERAEFFNWLRTSPAHVEEYLAIAVLETDLPVAASEPSMSLDSLRALAQTDVGNVSSLEGPAQARRVLPLGRELPPPQEGSRWRSWSFAATFMTVGTALVLSAAALAAWWLVHGRASPVGAQVYRTSRGVEQQWRLADGSVLHLDTDSQVSVRFSAGERRVVLDKGQALFEVAHDVRRPFEVAAGGAVVTATGTEFDVYRQRAATLVTVVQGEVSVARPAPTGDVDAASPTIAVAVRAGQQLRIGPGAPLGAPLPVDATAAIAWLQGQIVFDRRPLGEVADEFNRYNSLAVSIADPALRALPISGVFDAHDVNSFASFLDSLDGVRVERSPSGIEVSHRKP